MRQTAARTTVGEASRDHLGIKQQAAGGNAFAYAKKKSPHRLLHMPLEPEIGNLAEPHRRFVAGRSMRDVEPNVTLKVRDPHGNIIANADDLA